MHTLSRRTLGIALIACAAIGLSYWGTHRPQIGLGLPVSVESVYADVEATTSWTDIDTIAEEVHELVEPYRGEPDAAAQFQDGAHLLARAQAGKLKLWCHQIAKIYVAKAEDAGIPSRIVHTAGAGSGGHAFAESWDSDEKRWIFVDPTSGVFRVRDGERSLNGWEFLRHYKGGNNSNPFYKSYFMDGVSLVYPNDFHEHGSALNRAIAQIIFPKAVLTDQPIPQYAGLLLLYSSLTGCLIGVILVARRKKSTVRFLPATR